MLCQVQKGGVDRKFHHNHSTSYFKFKTQFKQQCKAISKGPFGRVIVCESLFSTIYQTRADLCCLFIVSSLSLNCFFVVSTLLLHCFFVVSPIWSNVFSSWMAAVFWFLCRFRQSYHWKSVRWLPIQLQACWMNEGTVWAPSRHILAETESEDTRCAAFLKTHWRLLTFETFDQTTETSPIFWWFCTESASIFETSPICLWWPAAQ